MNHRQQMLAAQERWSNTRFVHHMCFSGVWKNFCAQAVSTQRTRQLVAIVHEMGKVSKPSLILSCFFKNASLLKEVFKPSPFQGHFFRRASLHWLRHDSRSLFLTESNGQIADARCHVSHSTNCVSNNDCIVQWPN